MITELIMTVGVIFKDGEKGKRIVGGAESKEALIKSEISCGAERMV